MTRKRYWLPPLVLLLLLAGAVLTLPGFVASSAHRARMEALASALTGRRVQIGGRLSLSLFPPELTASRVVITGPHRERITARALTLDISLPALLRGQLSAENLILDTPSLAFPWPLPGGAAAITPPPWLAALHAQISRGDITLGGMHFTNVNADIFTGARGAVAVAGSGTLFGHAVSLSVSLSAPLLTGSVPLTLDASSASTSVHFAGGINPHSEVTGQLGFTLPQGSGNAGIQANRDRVEVDALQFAAGKADVSGNLTLLLRHPALSAQLVAQNLDVDRIIPHLPKLPALPITLALNATDTTLDGKVIPALQASLDTASGGVVLHRMLATLAAGATFDATGQMSAAGQITGRVHFAGPDLPGLFKSAGISPPPGWASATLSADLAGTAQSLAVRDLSGSIGQNSLTGQFVVTPAHITGALAFSQLALQPLLIWLAKLPAGGISADGQITAARASYGPVPLTQLLLDGTLGDGVNLRRVSADVYGGMAAGSLYLNKAGQAIAGRGFVALPSAAPLAALFPARWQIPAGLLQPRLNATLFVAGTPASLTTSLVGRLGDFSFTAAPVIDLTKRNAAGPVSLRNPDAIAAFSLFGLSQGLVWPGPGSISLRADFTASPRSVGLPDFVLSLGSLTADGRILDQQGVIQGDIDADTLALPPIPADIHIPWQKLANAHGALRLSATRLRYAGHVILQNISASLELSPDHASLAVAHAGLAGGELAGNFSATTGGTAPALRASFTASKLDPAMLRLPLSFPYWLSGGRLGASASLTATGYSPKIWLATLAGTASLTSTGGTLNGFDLAGIVPALRGASPVPGLWGALTKGGTAFSYLTARATLAQGNATLGDTRLSGPQGSATATGSIDIFDQDLAMDLTFMPRARPPLTVNMMALGGWAAPKHFPALAAALKWRPTPPPAPAG